MSTLSDLAKLIGLKADEACAVPSSGGGLRTHQLDIDPYDFLVQAEEDWELGGDASELNAIGGGVGPREVSDMAWKIAICAP